MQEDNTEITGNQRFEEYKVQELSEAMLSALIRKVIIVPDGGVEICWRFKDELLGENQTAAFIPEYTFTTALKNEHNYDRILYKKEVPDLCHRLDQLLI